MATPAPRAARASADFDDLVLEVRHVFVDYLIGQLAPHGLRADAEDVLQDALAKILGEWERWPDDRDLQRAWAWSAIKFAAREAIKRHYRHQRIAPTALWDMTEPGDNDVADRQRRAVGLAVEISRAAISDSANRDIAERYATRASLLGALSVLSAVEQAVLLRSAVDDADRAALAAELDLTTSQFDAVLFRARNIVRLIVRHADGNNVSEPEARLLWAMLDNQLRGREGKIFRRHYAGCATCQRLARIHGSVEGAGRRVVIALPAFLFAAPARSACESPTVDAGAMAGAAGAAGAGGAGAGAKVALALSLGTVALGGVGAGVLAHVNGYDRLLAPSSAARVTHGAGHAVLSERGVDPAVLARAAGSVREPPRSRAARPTRPRRPGVPSRASRPARSEAASAPKAAHSASAPQPAIPTQTSKTSPPAPAGAGRSRGGEFVIGDG